MSAKQAARRGVSLTTTRGTPAGDEILSVKRITEGGVPSTHTGADAGCTESIRRLNVKPHVNKAPFEESEDIQDFLEALKE